MGIYVFNIFSILVYALIVGVVNSRYDKSIYRVEEYKWMYSLIITILIVIQLYLTSTLKNDQIGYDTWNYVERYSQFAEMGIIQLVKHEWETGYVLFNKFVSILGFEYKGFSFIMYLFFYSSMFLFLKKESEIPWLSLFLFIAFDFFAFSLSVYRQFFAIIINMLSIKFVREEKPLKFLIMVILSSLFHQSAIVFLIVYPISRMKLTKTFYMVSISVALFLFFLGGRTINFLLSFYNRSQTVSSGSGYNYFVMLFAITLFGIFLYYKFRDSVDEKLRKNTELYIKIMIVTVVLQIFSFHISIFVRVVYYFSFYVIVFIPNLIQFIPNGNRRNVILSGVLSVGLILFLFFILRDVNGVTPYLFFWQ